jgi:hypothetical protein
MNDQDDVYIPVVDVQEEYHSVLSNNHKQKFQIPEVPPTPMPKRIADIQVDAKERFAGIIWMRNDSSQPIADCFIDYDYWERYSETKSYSKRSYQAAYKGIMREYHNYLVIVYSDSGEEYYIIAKRIRNELELLEEFCTCSRCIAFVFNPMKYIWCDHCTQCIKSGPGFANPEYVKKAKELKAAAETPVTSLYGKYFQGYRPVKMIEFMVGIAIIIIAVYCRI